MAEQDRAETMTRLLAEEGCDLVVRSFYQGTRDDDGTAFWNFACRNGRRFMVSVNADANGTTHVADCRVMNVLGTRCFQELDSFEGADGASSDPVSKLMVADLDDPSQSLDSRPALHAEDLSTTLARSGVV